MGTDDQSWVNLQARYDLEIARERLEGRLEKEVTPMTQVA
ncbi:Plasmid maintenance system antidote protein, XRE family (fragment) [Syntrophobacter sp. SbD1]